MPTIDVERESVADLVAGLAGAVEIAITGAKKSENPDYFTSVAPYLAVVQSASLETLIVDSPEQPMNRQTRVWCGDVTALFETCPALRRVHIIGAAPLTRLAHATLEDLTMLGDPMKTATVTAIASGDLPKLVRLAIGFAYEASPDEEADPAFIAAIATAQFPALKQLHLGWPQDAVALFIALVKTPLFAQLEVLSIDGGFFDDEAAGLAALRAAKLSNLRELYLPIHDVMDLSDDDLVREFPAIRGTDGFDAFSSTR